MIGEALVSDFDSVKKGLEAHLTVLVKTKGYFTMGDVRDYLFGPEPEPDWAGDNNVDYIDFDLGEEL